MPRVQAGQIELNYREAGTGSEPLVLIHGFQSSLRVWGDVIDHLPLDALHVFAFDLRGAGKSDAPPAGYSPAQYADDVAAAMTALGVATFHYAGTSMGAVTGMQMGLRHGDRLRSLTLIAPAPSDGWMGEPWAAEFLAALRSAREDPSRYPEVSRGMWTRAPRPELFEIYVEDALACSDGHFDESWEEMGRLHIGDQLATIPTPTLVVAGDRDFLRDSNLADHARIPNAALHIFYRVGHFIPWEVPRELAALLTDFITNGTAPQE